jgi:hypothetical protein
MIKAEIPIKGLSGQGKFRVEENGRVRLILEQPESRVILIGQWNEQREFLLLFKNKPDFNRRSFTLAIPLELWENLKVQTVALHERTTDTYLIASKTQLMVYGYQDDIQTNKQAYFYLDREYWHKINSLDEAMSYHEEQRRKNQKTNH